AALIAASLTIPPLVAAPAQAAPSDVAGIETVGPIPTIQGRGQARPDLPAGVAVMPRGSVLSPVNAQVYDARLADEPSVTARVLFLTGGRDAVIHNGALRNGWMTIPTTLVAGGDYEVQVDRGSGTWQRIGTFNVGTRSGGVGPMAAVGGMSVSTVTGEAAWSWTSEPLANSGLTSMLAWGSGVTRSGGVPDGWRLALNSGSPWSSLSERGPEAEALRQPGAPGVDRVSDTAVTVSYDYPYGAEAVLLQYRQGNGKWRLLARAGEKAEDLYLPVPQGPVDVRMGVKSDTGTVLWSDAVRATARPTAERPDAPLATAGRNSIATAGDAPAVVTLRGWDGSLMSFVRNDLGVYEQANGSSIPGYVNALTRESDGVWEFADTQGVVTRFVGGRPVSVSSQGQVTTSMQWDEQGRLVAASAGPGRDMTFTYAGSGACPDWTAHGFDAAPRGMLCRIAYPGGAATEIGYADGYLALVKDPGNVGTTLGWDTLGRLVSTRSGFVSQVATREPAAAGVLVRLDYDAQGRAFALVDQPDEAGAASQRREISFPAINDTVLRRWLAGTGEPLTARVRQVEAGPYRMGITYQVDPLQFTTISARDAAGLSIATRADARTGRLASSIDAQGRAVRYEYDDRGLVVKVKGPFTAGSGTRAAGDGTVTTNEYDTVREAGADRAMSGLRAQVYSKAQFGGDVSAEFWEAVPGQGGLSASWSGRSTQFSAQAAGVWVPSEADDAKGATAGWQFEVRASTDADVSFIIGGIVCVVNKPCLVRGVPKGPKAVTVQVARAASRGFFTVLAAPAGQAPALIPTAQVGPGYALATEQSTNDIVGGAELETRYAFDDPARGRPTEVIAPLGLTTAFAYEDSAKARLLRRTTPGGGVQSTEYWPESGAVPLPAPCGAGSAVASGQASTITRQDGTKVTTYFDARGRTIAAVDGDETMCITYFADSSVKATAIYVPAGLLESAVYEHAVDGDPRVTRQTTTHGDAAPVNPGGSVTTTSRVDLLGRAIETTSAAGVVTRTTYDILGNPTRVVQTPPVGDTLTFDYSYRATDGQLQSQSVNGVLAATLAYDEQTGRIASVAYPDSIRATFGYFGNGQLDQVSVASADPRFTRVAHSLDRADAGRILSESLIVRGTAAKQESRSYTYDEAGRLTRAVISTDGERSTFAYGFGTQAATCAASYQAGRDNLRTSGTRDGATYTTCYDASGRLASTTDPALGGSAEVSYDSRGRVTGISGAQALAIQWSEGTTLARLDEIRGDEFVRTTLDTYGSGILDKTVTTNEGSTTVRYGGPFLLAVTDGEATGLAATQYGLPGGATVTAEPGAGATLTIPGADGSALVTIPVPSLGAGAQAGGGLSPRFGPYGEPLVAPTSTSAIPDYAWRAGARQETLPGESSVTLMGARPYHPWLGIFLAPDPVVDAGNNMYGYTDGDPINQRDSTGNDSETLDWVARGLGIAGLLIGLGGAYGTFRFVNAPGVLNGAKAGITALMTGVAGAVVGAASTGVQIAAMVQQSGSVTADQWIVAIGSGVGALACAGAAVKGYKMYRSENTIYSQRLMGKETIQENFQQAGLDPALIKATLDRMDPATMTVPQMIKKVPKAMEKAGLVGGIGVKSGGGKFRLDFSVGAGADKTRHQVTGNLPHRLSVIAEE
ncbi:MAG: RHS repeat-associated core domain-containing protein, partial [bacterium]